MQPRPVAYRQGSRLRGRTSECKEQKGDRADKLPNDSDRMPSRRRGEAAHESPNEIRVGWRVGIHNVYFVLDRGWS